MNLVLTVINDTMKGVNSTGILSSVLHNNEKLVFFVLSFLLFIPSPWRETFLFTRQLKVQIGKITLYNITSKSNM